ncbi:MAG: CoA-binding protein [Planctomycetota bacterium]|jgi:predicted CoA-binding protein
MTIQEKIDGFLAGAPHAVVGASTDQTKYGNKVLRVYLQNDRPVYPINPKAPEVEGVAAFPDLRSLPEAVHGISVITPPKITEKVIQEAADLGIKHIWMQPGAESDAAIERAEQAGMSVIADGTCILVVLGFKN